MEMTEDEADRLVARLRRSSKVEVLRDQLLNNPKRQVRKQRAILERHGWTEAEWARERKTLADFRMALS